jgi:cell division protein FtsI/penicillin-binding protein 2
MNTKRRRFYRPEISSLSIPEKATKILNLVLLGIFIIVLRIWYLSVIQYEQKLEESLKPQRRVVVEAAKRGTIRDRFNIPLAINKIQYQAAIQYSQISQIPAVAWEMGPNGKKIKRAQRKEYITKLAQVLGEELHLDAERLEDLIYAKAAFYFQVPFIIKEDLSEQEYYRLKMLEKDWLGIHVQRIPKRHYPKGKVAADVIGYLGAINRQEYDSIIQQIQELKSYLNAFEEGEDVLPPHNIISYEAAEQRLKDLEEHCYTINDYVGKTGIEGRFEQDLRGYHGKKKYFSDPRGNFFRELPGSTEPLSGHRIMLTLSSELQEYAEKLLAQNEFIRTAKPSLAEAAKQTKLSPNQPWIKGGAIVALDPLTGEILALASYPRFDPNDFIPSRNTELQKQKNSNIMRWFETESYLADIWDQKRPLERETYDDAKEQFDEEKLLLSWQNYIDLILPQDSPIKQALIQLSSIEKVIKLQRNVRMLMTQCGETNAYKLFNCLYSGEMHKAYGSLASDLERKNIESLLKEESLSKLKKEIDNAFLLLPNNYDKVLLVDLTKVLLSEDLFSDTLIRHTGKMTPDTYHNASAAIVTLSEIMYKMTKELYHEYEFKEWRKINEKPFLKQKREAEKAAGVYAKPYIDYLDAVENEMFQNFWKTHRWSLTKIFLTGKMPSSEDPSLEPYNHYFLSWYQELSLGAHQALEWVNFYKTLQNSLYGLPADLIEPFLQSMRGFKDLTKPLLGTYRHLRHEKKQQLEKHLAAAFYPPRGFGYGRSQAFRQSATQGSIFKLVTAYEALIQRYNTLKKDEINRKNLNPLEMVDVYHKQGKNTYLGYTSDGTPIPRMYKGGRLLKSSSSAIGKIDLLRALETSSNPYFSLLAGDVLNSPEDLAKAAYQFSYGQCTGVDLPGEIPGKIPSDLLQNRTGLYAMANGQHSLVVTPLQTSVLLSSLANQGKVFKPKIVESKITKNSKGLLVTRTPAQIKRKLFMPDIVRSMLLDGMKRVVTKQLKDGLRFLSRFYENHPEAISDYLDVGEDLVGKTSTSEAMENLNLDSINGTHLYTHVWFGGIAFNKKDDQKVVVAKDDYGNPELVVVVYLRYGAFGKETAPLAAQMVKKWREIKAQNELKHSKERFK